MKKKFLLYLLTLSSLTFSEIKVRIAEPMRFGDINTTHVGKTKALGKGVIEVYTDNKEEDIGKKIVFEFPEYNLVTNRKNWVKVEKLAMETKDKEIIVTKEREQFNLYAVLERKDINSGKDADIIEGEYIGYIPIIVSQYRKREVTSEN